MMMPVPKLRFPYGSSNATFALSESYLENGYLNITIDIHFQKRGLTFQVLYSRTRPSPFCRGSERICKVITSTKCATELKSLYITIEPMEMDRYLQI
nr:hypothetical transcript [Hymenolepis microstoma]